MNYEPLVLNHNHDNVKPKELVKTPRISVVSSSIGNEQQAVVSRRIVSSTNPSRTIAGPEVVGKRGREEKKVVGEVGEEEEEDMLSALKRLKGGLNRNPNRNISTATASTGGTGAAMHPSIISRDAVIQVKVKVPSPKKKGPIMSSDIRPVDISKSNSSSNSSSSSVDTSRARDPRIIRTKGGGGGGGLDMQSMGSATDTTTLIDSSLVADRPAVDKEHLSVVDGSRIGSAKLSPMKPVTYDIDGSIIDTAVEGPYAGYFADPELETSSSSSSVVDRRPESASSEYRSETDDDDDIDDDDDEEEEVVDEDDPTEGWGDGGSSDDNDVEGSDLEDGEVIGIADHPMSMSMNRKRSVKRNRKRKRRLEEEAAAPDTSYEMQQHSLSTPSLLPPSLLPPSPISSSQSNDDPDSSDDDFSDFEAMILQRTEQMRRLASSGPAWSLPSQGRSLARNNNNHQGNNNNNHQGNHSNRGSDTTGNNDDSNSPN